VTQDALTCELPAWALIERQLEGEDNGDLF